MLLLELLGLFESNRYFCCSLSTNPDSLDDNLTFRLEITFCAVATGLPTDFTYELM